MMPLIRPDVIKLDISVIQKQTTPSIARIVNAVLAEAERSGAVVVAEGIESERHEEVARSLGATLGQGWFYGRPAPLPAGLPAPHEPISQRVEISHDASTPFEVVAGHRLNRASERLLVPMGVHLEYEVLNAHEPTVLLACFSAARYTAVTRSRYEFLAANAAFTGVLVPDGTDEPREGIRGARLDPDDPIRNEWCVVVLGPRFAGALLARRRTADGPSGQREFDFVITHDRDLVIAATMPIVSRLLAEGENSGPTRAWTPVAPDHTEGRDGGGM